MGYCRICEDRLFEGINGENNFWVSHGYCCESCYDTPAPEDDGTMTLEQAVAEFESRFPQHSAHVTTYELAMMAADPMLDALDAYCNP